MKIDSTGEHIRINAPEWYEREDFLTWINGYSLGEFPATWHKKGEEPTEYSDIFTLYDHEEGPDSEDMPEDIWESICEACKAAGMTYGIVWITNLEE